MGCVTHTLCDKTRHIHSLPTNLVLARIRLTAVWDKSLCDKLFVQERDRGHWGLFIGTNVSDCTCFVWWYMHNTKTVHFRDSGKPAVNTQWTLMHKDSEYNSVMWEKPMAENLSVKLVAALTVFYTDYIHSKIQVCRHIRQIHSWQLKGFNSRHCIHGPNTNMMEVLPRSQHFFISIVFFVTCCQRFFPVGYWHISLGWSGDP